MRTLAYPPDQISAFWSGVTAVAAVVTGMVAIVTLLAIKRDSRDRSRPAVVAELPPMTLARGTSELAIQNVGAGVAKDVKVTFDPELTEDTGQLTAFLVRRYSRTIPTMGPGRRLSNIYSQSVGDGSPEQTEPVPRDVVVTITYKDTHERVYEDRYALALDTLRNETTSSPANTDERGMQRRLVQALEAIARGVNRT